MHSKKLKLSIRRNNVLTEICHKIKFISILSSHCDVNAAICTNPEFIDFSKKIENIKCNIDIFMLRRNKNQKIKGEIVLNDNNSPFIYDFNIENEVFNNSIQTQKISFLPVDKSRQKIIITSFETEQVYGKNVLVEKFFDSNHRTIDYYTHYRAWILKDFVEKLNNNKFSHLFFSNCFNRVAHCYISETINSEQFFMPTFPFRLMRINASLFRKFLKNNATLLKKTKIFKPLKEISRFDIDKILEKKSNEINYGELNQ